MGRKVDFRPKNNSKLKKHIKIAVIVIIAILVVYIIIKGVIGAFKSLPQNVNEESKLYFDVTKYNSIDELLSGYDAKFLRMNDSGEILKIYVTFSKNLYTGDTSNRGYFWGIAGAVAKFENFKDFELIDENRDIDIEVSCGDSSIVEFKINGDVNYYLNHDSEINSKKSLVSTTNFTIQSNELQQLINENWNESKVDWGTRESTCNSYNIYFDEGIKYKVVSQNVYNVIFTSKYTGEVAGGLKTTSSKEDVEMALGKPSYEYSDSIYGYLGENNYLFFDFSTQEISVYPRVEVSTTEETKLKEIIEKMNNASSESGTFDVKTLASDLTELWIDYDVYDFNSNYVDLKYTLRGIELEISSSSLSNGLFICQNYSGDRDIQSLLNVYISDSDLVFEAEKERINNYNLSIYEMDYEDEEDLKARGVEFSIRFQGNLTSYETGYKGPLFYSRDGSYPDSELSKTLVISSYIWYDDYKLIYSVDDDGIYVYKRYIR
jgi:uncharacterized membrane protein YjfL (UPF0719 family)